MLEEGSIQFLQHQQQKKKDSKSERGKNMTNFIQISQETNCEIGKPIPHKLV